MLKFDKSIYSEAAIKRACIDYHEFAVIKMTADKDNYICTIVNTKSNPELIADEFCNYVLDLTVMTSGV